MEHLQDVTEARYFVEEVMKDLDLQETKSVMDPTLAQMDDDCFEEGIKEHPDFIFMNPDMIDDFKDERPIKSIYRKVEIEPIEILRNKTRQLDEFQRHVVDIGVKFSKDVVKSRNNFSKQPDPVFLMVHGGAGAGKSTVINVLAQWIQLILQKEGNDTSFPCVLKVAPTGTAASNIEGQTLHTAFHFSYSGKIFSLGDKHRDTYREVLKNLKVVSKKLILFIIYFHLKYVCFLYNINLYTCIFSKPYIKIFSIFHGFERFYL